MGEGGNHIMEDTVAICIVNLPGSRALHRAKVQQLKQAGSNRKDFVSWQHALEKPKVWIVKQLLSLFTYICQTRDRVSHKQFPADSEQKLFNYYLGL